MKKNNLTGKILILSILLTGFSTAKAQFEFINCYALSEFESNLFISDDKGGNIWWDDVFASSGPKWNYRRTGVANGSLDGNVVQTIVRTDPAATQLQEAPDIYLLEQNIFNAAKTYEVYLVVESPASQLWSVKAKLEGATDYVICNKNTPGGITIAASDGSTGRIFRILLGTVTGKTDLRVDFSIDTGETVQRSSFDGIQYREITNTNVNVIKLTGLHLSSNPIRDYLIVGSDNYNITEVRVMDLNARVMYQSQENSKEHRISTLNWGKGIYVVRIDTEKGSGFYKMIKN
ncbi:MAG: T9SS type A sorting domain-containing protein [Candidatus Symbiothrix sp.]|jgi:hypothetical protein|nr:T9SS type A sorting domain-containing protein [Candidatus Symbiothrix sp.]